MDDAELDRMERQLLEADNRLRELEGGLTTQVAAPISPHSGFDAAVTRTDTSTAGHQADAVQHTTSTFSSWIAARSREASPTRVAASHQASPLSPSRPMSTIRSVLMSSPTRSSSAPLDSQALEQQSQLASALARVNDLSAELSAADAAARQRTNEALAAQAAAEAEAQARHAVLQARQVELAEARAALAAAAREQAAQAKALRVAKAEAAELRQQLATARAEARSAGSDKDVLAAEVSRLKVELSAAHEALTAQRALKLLSNTGVKGLSTIQAPTHGSPRAMAALRRHVTSVSTELTSLQAAFASSQAVISTLRAENERLRADNAHLLELRDGASAATAQATQVLRATAKFQEALATATSGQEALRARAESAEAAAQERDVLVERVLKENGVLREQLQLALAQLEDLADAHAAGALAASRGPASPGASSISSLQRNQFPSSPGQHQLGRTSASQGLGSTLDADDADLEQYLHGNSVLLGRYRQAKAAAREAQAAVAKAVAAVQQAEATATQAEAKASQAEGRASEARAALEAAEARTVKAEAAAAAAEARGTQAEAARAQEASARGALSAAEARAVAAEAAAQAAQQALASVQGTLQAHLQEQESLRSKLAAAETRATQLEQARSSAASTLESELRTLQARAASTGAELAAKTTEVARYKADLERASALLEDARAVHGQLADQLRAATSELRRLTSLLETRDREVASLKQAAQVARSQADASQLRLAQLGAAHEAAQAETARLLAANSSLSSELRAAQAAAAAAATSQQELSAQVQALTAAHEDLQSAEAGLLSSYLGSELAGLEQELADREAVGEALSERLAAAKSLLSHKLAEAAARVAASTAAQASAEHQLEQKEHEVAALRHQLALITGASSAAAAAAAATGNVATKDIARAAAGAALSAALKQTQADAQHRDQSRAVQNQHTVSAPAVSGQHQGTYGIGNSILLPPRGPVQATGRYEDVAPSSYAASDTGLSGRTAAHAGEGPGAAAGLSAVSGVTAIDALSEHSGRSGHTTTTISRTATTLADSPTHHTSGQQHVHASLHDSLASMPLQHALSKAEKLGSLAGILTDAAHALSAASSIGAAEQELHTRNSDGRGQPLSGLQATLHSPSSFAHLAGLETSPQTPELHITQQLASYAVGAGTQQAAAVSPSGANSSPPATRLPTATFSLHSPDTAATQPSPQQKFSSAELLHGGSTGTSTGSGSSKAPYGAASTTNTLVNLGSVLGDTAGPGPHSERSFTTAAHSGSAVQPDVSLLAAVDPLPVHLARPEQAVSISLLPTEARPSSSFSSLRQPSAMSHETAQALARAAEQDPLPAQGSVAAWASSLSTSRGLNTADAGHLATPSTSVGHQGHVARTVAAFEASTGGTEGGSPSRSGSTGVSGEAVHSLPTAPQQQQQGIPPPSPSSGLSLEEILLRARRATASPREALNAATSTILGRLSPRASEPNIRALLQPTSALVSTAQARASMVASTAHERSVQGWNQQVAGHGDVEPRPSAAAGILPRLDDLSSHAQMLAERMADLDQALAALSTAPS